MSLMEKRASRSLVKKKLREKDGVNLCDGGLEEVGKAKAKCFGSMPKKVALGTKFSNMN